MPSPSLQGDTLIDLIRSDNLLDKILVFYGKTSIKTTYFAFITFYRQFDDRPSAIAGFFSGMKISCEYFALIISAVILMMQSGGMTRQSRWNPACQISMPVKGTCYGIRIKFSLLLCWTELK
jgi:hypothetical protein